MPPRPRFQVILSSDSDAEGGSDGALDSESYSGSSSDGDGTSEPPAVPPAAAAAAATQGDPEDRDWDPRRRDRERKRRRRRHRQERRKTEEGEAERKRAEGMMETCLTEMPFLSPPGGREERRRRRRRETAPEAEDPLLPLGPRYDIEVSEQHYLDPIVKLQREIEAAKAAGEGEEQVARLMRRLRVMRQLGSFVNDQFREVGGRRECTCPAGAGASHATNIKGGVDLEMPTGLGSKRATRSSGWKSLTSRASFAPQTHQPNPEKFGVVQEILEGHRVKRQAARHAEQLLKARPRAI